MLKKISAGVLVVMMIAALAAVGVSAEPYREQIITNTRLSDIEAVWFDIGAGHDSRADENDRGIRPDGPAQTEFGGSGFEGNVGWTAAGDWVQYTVTVMDADTYRIYVYIAVDASPGNVMIYIDDEEIGATQIVGSTGGWQVYEWAFVDEVELEPGEIVIRVRWISGGSNVAALRFWTETGAIGDYIIAAEDFAGRAAEAAEEAAAYAAEARAAADSAPASPAAMEADNADRAAGDAASAAESAANYAAAAAGAADVDAAAEAREAARAANAAAGQARGEARTARNNANREAEAYLEAAAADVDEDDDADAGEAAAPAPPAAATADDGGPNVIIFVIIGAAAVAAAVVIIIVAKKKKA